MKKIIVVLLIGLMILTACSGAAVDEPSAPTTTDTTAVNEPLVAETTGETDGETAVESTDVGATNVEPVDSAPVNNESAPAPAPSNAELSEDYAGALPKELQIAVGLLQLEQEGALLMEGSQAEQLLLLWQALQSLSASSATADVELQAVVKQIEASLTAPQIAAIAAQQFTEADLTALIESGTISVGRGNRGQGTIDGSTGMPAGGGPGRGMGGGAGSGLGGVEADPNAIATRQAEMESGNVAGLQNQMVFNAVIRLLESKAGIVTAQTVQRLVMDEAVTAVANAANLSNEEVQAAVTAGQTRAQIVTANGGDLIALQAQLVEIFSQLPNAADLDLEQWTADWLGL